MTILLNFLLMRRTAEKIIHEGVVIYGPDREEHASAIHLLLNDSLPPGWEWVHSSANSIVARRLRPSTVYYKEFLSRSSCERMKGLLRGSRSQRAVVRGEMLKQRGFHTPAILCWGEKGHRNFMITEGLSAVSLSSYMEENWIPTLSGTELLTKKDIIEKLGKEVGKLHKAGICHGDLRLSNILVKERGQDIVFYFIDNERTLLFKKIPRKLIVKNLVQLNMIFLPGVSRQDRLRFFAAYNEMYDRFTAGKKMTLMVEVQKRTTERLARKFFKDSRQGQGKA